MNQIRSDSTQFIWEILKNADVRFYLQITRIDTFVISLKKFRYLTWRTVPERRKRSV